MAGKGWSYAAIGIGGVFLWSALFNQKITSTIQQVVSGQKPTPGPNQDLSVASAPSSASGGGGGGGSQPPAPSGPGENAYWTSLLGRLGAMPTAANLTGLNAWFHHEEPSWPPPCDWNPMNTKEPAPGSFPCHAAPQIQAYPNELTGIEATARTLQGYPQIVQALRSGKGICGSAFSSEFLTWSGNGYSSVC